MRTAVMVIILLATVGCAAPPQYRLRLNGQTPEQGRRDAYECKRDTLGIRPPIARPERQCAPWDAGCATVGLADTGQDIADSMAYDQQVENMYLECMGARGYRIEQVPGEPVGLARTFPSREEDKRPPSFRKDGSRCWSYFWLLIPCND